MSWFRALSSDRRALGLAVIGGALALLVVAVVLGVTVLNPPGGLGQGDPSASPSPIAMPSAATSPSSSVEPSPVPSSSVLVAPSSTAEPTAGPPTMLRVQVPGLRLRTQPNAAADVVRTMAAGATVRVVGGPERVDGFDWYEVANGEDVGWVATGEDGAWLAAVRNGRIGFGCVACGPDDDGRATVAMRPDGTGLEMLFPSVGFVRWSPDGTSMVIEQTEDAEWPQQHLQEGDAAPRLLGAGTSAAWSPDGTKLAFLNPDRTLTLHGVYPEPIGLSVLDHGALGSLAWSPDSTRLAFVGVDCPECPPDQPIMGDPPMGIFVVEPPGGAVQRLAGAAMPWGLTWLPDGSGLTYLETDYDEETTTSRLMLVELSVEGARTVREWSGWLSGHAASQDGTRVAVGTHEGIIVTDQNGANPRPVVPATQETNPSPRNPRWSPDGEWILFDMVWVTGDAIEAWIVRADGTDAHQLSDDAYEASWQPILEPLPARVTDG